jgi:hypothetical protein
MSSQLQPGTDAWKLIASGASKRQMKRMLAEIAAREGLTEGQAKRLFAHAMSVQREVRRDAATSAHSVGPRRSGGGE